MKHMSTWDLLDLAKDYREFARMFAATDESNERYLATRSKLAAIDTELLSRMPEGEFMTVCDYTHTVGDLAYFVEFLPVGFESECYTRLAEAQAELLDADYATDQLIGLDLGV